ncbi:MAG: hypothetical protein ACRDJN_08340 [Chloroflexota bacterium]
MRRKARVARARALLAVTMLALALLAGAVLVLNTGDEVSAAPVPPCYFVASGETAVVGWENENTSGLLIVERGACRAVPGAPPLNPFALGTSTDTYLHYVVTECCWRAVQYGEGAIRGSDLQGGGTSRLTLHTDTSAAANPYFYRYVGAGGVIAVEWEPDQSYTIRRTGLLMARHGSFSFHSNGTSLSSAARVQGSVIGATVSGPFWLPPSLGTSHDVRFELQRGGR